MIEEGFKEQEMYKTVRDRIRVRFPAYEGWEIYEQDDWGAIKPDFVVERRNEGIIERAIIEVKSTCSSRQTHIDQINKYARHLAGNNCRIVEKILVYPGSSNTQLVEDYYRDITLMKLRNFYCD